MSSQSQWMLFGIDMRHIGQQWVSAWREFLFSPVSPLRRLLDEPVQLLRPEGAQIFQGGVPGGAPATLQAQLLPDELALVRPLTIPIAAEAELPAVLQHEVAAGSPFTPEDTVYGWVETGRDATHLRAVLAIASRASVGAWLREQVQSEATADADDADAALPEVWVDAQGTLVTLAGFGEHARDEAYRKRLIRVGLMGLGVLLLVVLCASLFAMHEGARLKELQQLQAQIAERTRPAVAMRETVARANTLITAANDELRRFPNPHRELVRLTDILDDSVYVAHFSMRGDELRIRGRAEDAAQVMQTLAETPAFSSVTAPSAITAVGNTGLEQFNLDITLQDAAGEGEAP